MALPINVSDLINRRVIESARIEYKGDWNPEPILHSRLEDVFPKIDSDITMDQRDSSEEYSKLQQKIFDLKQQNPFIMKLMEGSGSISGGIRMR